MKYQDRLLNKVEQFNSRAGEGLEGQDYYEMLSSLTQELVDLERNMESLKQNPRIKNKLMPYEGQWLDLLEELCESLEVLEEQSYAVVKGKKIYESVDEIIADLEDWIECVNEVLEDEEINMSYLEAWDIGVFFE